ncbi:MAG: PCYCGC motif-containing (lipo)protein [Candidatus Hodarchaeales archaeon]|jgi:hypothetical protein
MSRKYNRKRNSNSGNSKNHKGQGTENIDKILTNINKDNKSVELKKSNNNVFYKATLLIVPVLIVGLVLSNSLSNPQIGNVNPSPDKQLPDNMPSRYDQTLTTGPQLQEAYDYASTNGDVLSQLICYCGCNNTMHQPYHENNKECFWTSTGAYESHAETCSTCVYIALSAKTLNSAGWTPFEIRSYIDAQYA